VVRKQGFGGGCAMVLLASMYGCVNDAFELKACCRLQMSLVAGIWGLLLLQCSFDLYVGCVAVSLATLYVFHL
jgi:hypothetical protein